MQKIISICAVFILISVFFTQGFAHPIKNNIELAVATASTNRTYNRLASAASSVNPSVISIIISKNVPEVSVSYQRLTFNDPFFDSLDIVVPIYTQTGRTTKRTVGAGSGIIIDQKGYVLTNNHVVADPSASYTARLSDGKEIPLKVVETHSEIDAAIVKIDGTHPTIASIGDSSKLSIRQPIVAIGNAYGVQANSVSPGVISGFNQHVIARGPQNTLEELRGLIRTNANIAPGYSGGPLVDANGSVIGLNVAEDTESEASFSIPINALKPLIKKYTT